MSKSKLEIIGVFISAIGIIIAAIALIPAFGDWLFPREPVVSTPSSPSTASIVASDEPTWPTGEIKLLSSPTATLEKVSTVNSTPVISNKADSTTLSFDVGSTVVKITLNIPPSSVVSLKSYGINEITNYTQIRTEFYPDKKLMIIEQNGQYDVYEITTTSGISVQVNSIGSESIHSTTNTFSDGDILVSISK